MKDQHVLHFTHIDSDALGCDVLIKYLYEKHFKCYDVTTYYISNHNVDVFIQDTISTLIHEMGKVRFNPNIDKVYDIIYITDIGPNKDSIEKIIEYKNKVKEIFGKDVKLYGLDHHITNTLNNNYKWFIVADSLYSLYNYKDMILDKSDAFKLAYYPFRWMHDNINKEYTSYDQVVKEKSLKISATMLVFIHILTLNPVFLFENTPAVGSFIKFVKDISCYDTWEWKNNKYIDCTGNEDMTSKLCDMVGIEKATNIILDTISYKIGLENGENLPYIPDKYLSIYEYEKYKSFEYVKRTYNNVKILTGPNIKGFFNILKIPDLYDESIEKVYISISDNTIDLGEQSTFVTNYLCEDKCIFMHMFVTSKTLSFRSRAGSDVDVSIIAKELGGGGHKNASGVRVTADIIGKLVVMYHINGEDIIDILDGNSIANYIECLTEYKETLPKIRFDYDITDVMKGK